VSQVQTKDFVVEKNENFIAPTVIILVREIGGDSGRIFLGPGRHPVVHIY